MTLAGMEVKQLLPPTRWPCSTDSSISADASYQPNLSQAIDKVPQRKPHLLISSASYPGIIVDVIIVRQDDLKANPEKYKKYMIAIFQGDRVLQDQQGRLHQAGRAALLSVSRGVRRASIEGSLEYTGKTDGLRILRQTGRTRLSVQRAFDEVMPLNLENGGGRYCISNPPEHIDSSVVAGI